MDAPRATLIRAVHSAVRYGSASGSVSDIWLPDVVARTIPQRSIPLVTFGLLLHLRGIRRERRSVRMVS
jgi:hypothetical protein